MKEIEATGVVSFLHGAFSKEPTPPQMQAWVEVVLPLDAQVAMDVAKQMHKTLLRMPSAAAFLSSVRAESERGHASAMRRPRCELCDGNAMVIVYIDPKGHETMGPCPVCPEGKRREASWGSDGYWQGRKYTKTGHMQVEIALT